MSGPVQRQPWFWAILTAVAALFIFSMVIVAANRDDRADSTTVVQQPAPEPRTEVVPVPAPVTPPPASVPASPAPPAPPAVRERTVIIHENEPAKPAPAPRSERRRPEAGTTERPSDPGSKNLPAPEPAEGRITEIKEFRSTGLPAEIRHENRTWKATEERTVTEPETELKSIGMTADGAELWVPVQAKEPYDPIFVAVLDEEGRYVVYRRR